MERLVPNRGVCMLSPSIFAYIWHHENWTGKHKLESRFREKYQLPQAMQMIQKVRQKAMKVKEEEWKIGPTQHSENWIMASYPITSWEIMETVEIFWIEDAGQNHCGWWRMKFKMRFEKVMINMRKANYFANASPIHVWLCGCEIGQWRKLSRKIWGYDPEWRESSRALRRLIRRLRKEVKM